MDTRQIALARAYLYYQQWIDEHPDDDNLQINEEMICIRYWYAGIDPNTDPQRHHIPPPPPPPPPPF